MGITKIEDEIHFLLVCPVYENERVALLSTTQNDSSFNNLNSFEKILYLCNNYPRQLTKFICRAYEHRQSLVFTLVCCLILLIYFFYCIK